MTWTDFAKFFGLVFGFIGFCILAVVVGFLAGIILFTACSFVIGMH